jgi:heat shock protein HslJ
VNYSIEATGTGGTSRLQRQVFVSSKPTPQMTDTPVPPQATDTPVPPPETPTPIPPVIYTFIVNPAQIQANECVTASWQVGGDAAQIELLRDGIVILPNAPFSGSIQDCLSTAGSYTYRLEVLSRNGDTVAEEQGVTVTEASTGLPLQGTTWFLESYYDGVAAMIGMIPGTSITAVFGEDGQLSGSSSCNTYSANYTTDGSSISIGPPTGTQSLCTEPPDVMEQEASYLSVLPNATSYEISSSYLTIQDANGRVVLQYTARRT